MGQILGPARPSLATHLWWDVSASPPGDGDGDQHRLPVGVCVMAPGACLDPEVTGNASEVHLGKTAAWGKGNLLWFVFIIPPPEF